MLANHLPEKENRSPSPTKAHHSKQGPKTVGPVLELRNLLKSHDITIPPHLARDQDENGRPFMRLLDAVDPLQLQKLKARLADKEFEAKRIDEDFAEFKLFSRLEHEKITRKLREELSALKSKLFEQNTKWQSKFKETAQRHEEEGDQFRKRTESHFKKLKEEEVQLLKQLHSEEVAQLAQELSSQHLKHQEAENNKAQENEERLRQLMAGHRQEVESLTVQHERTVKKTEQIHEGRVLAMECEKKAEVKEAEQVKQTTSKKEEQYLRQIGTIEQEKRKLLDKVEDISMRLKVLQHKYEDIGKQMQKQKNSHEQSLLQMKNQLQKVKSETEDSVTCQKLKVLKEHYAKTETLERRLKELEEVKESMVSQFRLNQKTLDRKFARRESRQEDVEAIKEMGYKLSEKERETAKLYKNMNYFRLEKENNDKIYTRIFTSSREKKGSVTRPERDLFSVLKQAHTTDLRHILKITSKDPQ